MSENVQAAVRGLKAVGSEITQWENRLEYVKVEVEKNTKARDALLAEISKKTDDFNAYMANRDAEIKKSRVDMLAEKEELKGHKDEFQKILSDHRIEKEQFEEAKRDFEIQKLRQASSVQNVQEFIIAVRRATGLLGI